MKEAKLDKTPQPKATPDAPSLSTYITGYERGRHTSGAYSPMLTLPHNDTILGEGDEF
jgi:hypothetical protein